MCKTSNCLVGSLLLISNAKAGYVNNNPHSSTTNLADKVHPFLKVADLTEGDKVSCEQFMRMTSYTDGDDIADLAVPVVTRTSKSNNPNGGNVISFISTTDIVPLPYSEIKFSTKLGAMDNPDPELFETVYDFIEFLKKLYLFKFCRTFINTEGFRNFVKEVLNKYINYCVRFETLHDNISELRSLKVGVGKKYRFVSRNGVEVVKSLLQEDEKSTPFVMVDYFALEPDNEYNNTSKMIPEGSLVEASPEVGADAIEGINSSLESDDSADETEDAPVYLVSSTNDVIYTEDINIDGKLHRYKGEIPKKLSGFIKLFKEAPSDWNSWNASQIIQLYKCKFSYGYQITTDALALAGKSFTARRHIESDQARLKKYATETGKRNRIIPKEKDCQLDPVKFPTKASELAKMSPEKLRQIINNFNKSRQNSITRAGYFGTDNIDVIEAYMYQLVVYFMDTGLIKSKGNKC